MAWNYCSKIGLLYSHSLKNDLIDMKIFMSIIFILYCNTPSYQVSSKLVIRILFWNYFNTPLLASLAIDWPQNQNSIIAILSLGLPYVHTSKFHWNHMEIGLHCAKILIDPFFWRNEFEFAGLWNIEKSFYFNLEVIFGKAGPVLEAIVLKRPWKSVKNLLEIF